MSDNIKNRMVAKGAENVFFPSFTDIVCVKKPNIETIKKAAKSSDVKRARYCIHASHEDSVQEMVLALCKGTEIPIHRHADKTESFHIIEGEVDVLLFNNEGKQTDSIKMGSCDSGMTFMYRINTDIWHTVNVISEIVVIHEIVQGPFNHKMEILELSK